jgi:hypothetical protein
LSVSSASNIEATLTVGSGSDTFVFDPSSGPTYSGNARVEKTLTLNPEYPGAVLSAFYGGGTETNITGTMTSDAETSGTNDLRTYYEWNRSSATLHSYTVAVRITLPQDYSAWQASNALVVMLYLTAYSASKGQSLPPVWCASTWVAIIVFTAFVDIISVAMF